MQRCSGHSSTVRGLDWSGDSSLVQTDSADMELLVWSAKTGKQVWTECLHAAHARELAVECSFP